MCGGQYDITASPDRGYFNNATATFTVAGMPPIGSKVIRGPDWNFSAKYNPVTVYQHCIPPHKKSDKGGECSLLVRFDDGKSYYVEWGDNSKYVVELAGCSTDNSDP